MKPAEAIKKHQKTVTVDIPVTKFTASHLESVKNKIRKNGNTDVERAESFGFSIIEYRVLMSVLQKVIKAAKCDKEVRNERQN